MRLPEKISQELADLADSHVEYVCFCFINSVSSSILKARVLITADEKQYEKKYLNSTSL